MIRRLPLYAFLLLVLAVLVVLLARLVDSFNEKEVATVYLKPGLVEQDKREGEVTSKDKYIVVKTDQYGEEFFTWDQVRYVSQKGKVTLSKKVAQIVDLIDVVSKLGIAASIVVFMIGLYQYGQGQKWKREEFLAAEVKEFIDQPSVRAAAHMLDSLALYPNGREIALFPDEEKRENRVVHVSNDEIYDALTTHPAAAMDDKAKAIRGCFDNFLSYLITFYHYLDQRLITKQGLLSHIGYWFEIIGPDGDLECRYKRRIYEYADYYKLRDVERLVKKYHGNFDWRTLKCSAPDIVRSNVKRAEEDDTPVPSSDVE